ncbi:MAG: hypothetical protein GY795_15680 [Desulfobacterales bacterium]|nr:hypothetical protein [Desulfobacterales bacterium]
MKFFKRLMIFFFLITFLSVIIVPTSSAVIKDLLQYPMKLLIKQTGNDKSPYDSLPLTKAVPGYLAEAKFVTTTLIKYFSEEKKLDEYEEYSEEKEGVVVHARLYTPTDRFFLSVDKIENIKAVDDKGRHLPSSDNNTDPVRNILRSFDFSEKNTHADFEIYLMLPEPDAEMIEQITGQVTAITHGKWKEYRIDKVKDDPGKEYDIGAILPGAAMIIKKIKKESDEQLGIDIQLKGPDKIRHIKFKTEKAGYTEISAHESTDRITEQDNLTVRNIVIWCYLHDTGSDGIPSPDSGDLSLIVMFPGDLKKELVKFSLKEIDLY